MGRQYEALDGGVIEALDANRLCAARRSILAKKDVGDSPLAKARSLGMPIGKKSAPFHESHNRDSTVQG
jgi:hypothetical protein